MRVVHRGGPEVQNHLRAHAGDSTDDSLVPTNRDSFIAPMRNQRRRFLFFRKFVLQGSLFLVGSNFLDSGRQSS